VKGAESVDAIIKQMESNKLGSVAGAAAICIHGICDDHGGLLYEDANDLDDMEVAPLLRCMDVLLELSGFSEDANKEAEKNSSGRRGSSRSS